MTTDPISERILERARDVLRDTPEPGWDAVVEQVLARVRATPRQGWPIRAEDPAADVAPGGIAVSDMALSGEIARTVRRLADVELDGIDLAIEDERLTGVRVELAGHYGARLGPTGGVVRTAIEDVLADALGIRAVGVPIDVVFTDVADPTGAATDDDPTHD